MKTLQQYRIEYEQAANRSVSLPLAGMIIWALIGAVSLFVPFKLGLIIMMGLTGAIFPISLLIGKFRSEKILGNDNPLSKLMFASVIMVNLLWAVHIPVLFHAAELLPMSLGIALGLHWMIYSWVVNHPLGKTHAIVRTLMIFGVWLSAPINPILSVSLAVIIAYAISIYQMLTREIEGDEVLKTDTQVLS